MLLTTAHLPANMRPTDVHVCGIVGCPLATDTSTEAGTGVPSPM